MKEQGSTEFLDFSFEGADESGFIVQKYVCHYEGGTKESVPHGEGDFRFFIEAPFPISKNDYVLSGTLENGVFTEKAFLSPDNAETDLGGHWEIPLRNGLIDSKGRIVFRMVTGDSLPHFDCEIDEKGFLQGMGEYRAPPLSAIEFLYDFLKDYCRVRDSGPNPITEKNEFLDQELSEYFTSFMMEGQAIHCPFREHYSPTGIPGSVINAQQYASEIGPGVYETIPVDWNIKPAGFWGGSNLDKTKPSTRRIISSYKGCFKDGRFHGKGTLEYGGDSYEGDFESGLFHGKGTISMSNGEKFSGSFVEGLAYGPCEHFYPCTLVGEVTPEPNREVVNVERMLMPSDGGKITQLVQDLTFIGEYREGRRCEGGLLRFSSLEVNEVDYGSHETLETLICGAEGKITIAPQSKKTREISLIYYHTGTQRDESGRIVPRPNPTTTKDVFWGLDYDFDNGVQIDAHEYGWVPDSWEFDDNRDFFFGGVYVGRAPLLGKPSMNAAPSIGKGVFWFEHEFPAVYVGEFGSFNGNFDGHGVLWTTDRQDDFEFHLETEGDIDEKLSADGYFFMGQWKNGSFKSGELKILNREGLEAEGHGCQVLYKGDFDRYGKLTGQGTMAFEKNTGPYKIVKIEYEGNFVHGKKSGRGSLYQGGERIEGTFYGGKSLAEAAILYDIHGEKKYIVGGGPLSGLFKRLPNKSIVAFDFEKSVEYFENQIDEIIQAGHGPMKKSREIKQVISRITAEIGKSEFTPRRRRRLETLVEEIEIQFLTARERSSENNPPTRDDEMGTRFSKIHKLRDEGGMAVVHLAKDKATGERVIWKQAAPHRKLSTKEANAALANEIAVLEKLDHPRIPGFVASGHVEDEDGESVLVLIMEHVEGTSLDEEMKTFITRGVSQSLDQAFGTVMECCETLEHMADLEPPLYHRDIKPHNIIIHPSRGAVLIDFGLSKEVKSGSGMSLTAGAHTAGWAPPERERSQTGSYTDVYSLGQVLRHMLTNEPAGVYSEEEHVKAITEAGHPEWLAELIHRATLPVPIEDRIQTVAEFRIRLENEGEMPE